jgi:hypothetical protein
MPEKASFQINFGKHHFENAAKCFVFRNIFKRRNFELPATFAAALADALQLKALLVFAQEELVTLMNKKFLLPACCETKSIFSHTD